MKRVHPSPRVAPANKNAPRRSVVSTTEPSIAIAPVRKRPIPFPGLPRVEILDMRAVLK